jgi:SP family sugar:H+ symporter-like MFS transporter
MLEPRQFNRRWPLIIGGVWQSIWLFVFAAAGTAGNPIDDPAHGKLMIAGACLFILGYASTWAPGIWILVREEHTRFGCEYMLTVALNI